MKLKAKLAEEYADKLIKSNHHGVFIAGFLTGFEKAREMAWEALGETEYAVHPRIQALLLNLGEEEV